MSLWSRGRAGVRWAGLAVAAGAGVAAAMEVPYINWQPVVPPLEAQPLVIRQDAKGDGRFQAPRSGSRRHRGGGLIGELQSPVHAIRSGRVREARFHRGLGWFVELEHRGGLTSLYAHLHETRVAPGMRVRQGDVIGTVGKTGNARHAWIIPHLHLEVLRDGAPIDPERLGLRFAQAQPVSAGTGSDERGGE